MNVEQIIRYEDNIAGRVIPRWRYWLAYSLVLVGMVLVQALPDGFWWRALSAAVALSGVSFCFGRYRRRTIAP